MSFLAGMGGNDLVEFAAWEGETPCGWVNIPLDGVGGRNGGWVRDDMLRRNRRRSTSAAARRQRGGLVDDEENDSEAGDDAVPDDLEDPYAGNVLKAMVIQMRVLENHQNGKDTHVRGLQVFACDDQRRRVAAAGDRPRRQSLRHSRWEGMTEASHGPLRLSNEDVDTSRLISTSGLEEPDWMGDPVIR